MNQPKEIALNYLCVAKAKTTMTWYKIFVLAVLAGAFIALGGALSCFASAGFSGTQASLIKGAVFPLGLILVVICGAELFTGNCLLIAPVMSKEVKVTGMLKNWGLAYIGNFAGAVMIAALVVGSHLFGATAASISPSGLACIATAAAKCNAGFGDIFLRGILCNMLVCLAVWAAMASKSAGGKILAVYMPVFAFVVCGFEHSIANMYYLVSGLTASAMYGLPAAGLNFGNALAYCLIPSTLGNIIGGALIALAYFTVYFRGNKPPQNAD